MTRGHLDVAADWLTPRTVHPIPRTRAQAMRFHTLSALDRAEEHRVCAHTFPPKPLGGIQPIVLAYIGTQPTGGTIIAFQAPASPAKAQPQPQPSRSLAAS